MSLVRVEIDQDSLRLFSRALKEIDPELRKQVGKDIKSALKPVANSILSTIPTEAPLSGMARHSGRTRWSKPQAGVYATPGSGSGSIARIEIFGKGQYKAGFKLADLAGTRNSGDKVTRAYSRTTRSGTVIAVQPHRTRSGDALISRLQQRYPLSAGGRGGRFAWQAFMEKRPELIDNVLKIINRYVDTINAKGLR